MFYKVQQVAGFCCDVDVLASVANYKCKKFIVRANNGIPHPGIIGYDFLNFDYKKLDGMAIYAFPPKVLVEQVASVLLKHFADSKFILIFHQWYEIPLGISALLGIPTTELITLSKDEAITYIPSEEKRSLPLGNFKGTYQFNGTPNIKPRSTRMVVNRPDENRKRKRTSDIL